jgi:aspartate/methionine/tyrosine aminotransferase
MFAKRTNWNLTLNRFSRAVQKHREGGRSVIDLTASNPTECGLSYDAVSILSSLVNPHGLEYHPQPKGLLSAREAVSDYYAERAAVVDPQQVLLTTSTSEAYSFIFRLLCDPGDEVLVPAPSYPLFEFLADLQDVRLVSYPLFYDHGWQMDVQSLERTLTPRSRAILVVNPNNPTGSFVKSEEAARLSAVCAARGLALVADEVFLDYALDGMARSCFAANADALTLTLSGLSKISALPQMKLAWLVVSGPPTLGEEARARLEVIADTYLSLNTPVQLAAPVLLAQRHAIQPQLRKRIAHNLDELDKQLAGQKACSRLQVEGGWYAIVRVPATRSDEDLAIELLEKQSVLVHPGHFYDFAVDGYLVVSVITPVADFKEGIARVMAHLS